MQLTVDNAIALLNLSTRSRPQSPEEEQLLLMLVAAWLVEHGEVWVKSNFLLEDEWMRHREKLARAKQVGKHHFLDTPPLYR